MKKYLLWNGELHNLLAFLHHCHYNLVENIELDFAETGLKEMDLAELKATFLAFDYDSVSDVSGIEDNIMELDLSLTKQLCDNEAADLRGLLSNFMTEK